MATDEENAQYGAAKHAAELRLLKLISESTTSIPMKLAAAKAYAHLVGAKYGVLPGNDSDS